jgi:ribosomal protein S18 acetylase RimI-like enzyme
METIRAAQPEDAAGIARVHVASWRTTYEGIFPAELLASLSYARREQSWQRILDDPAQITLVATDESGKIIGFVNGGPERDADSADRGELNAIYILQEAHRHGLGLRLVKELARQLVERQFSSMMLWTIASNPACRFYAALGGQVIRQRQAQVGGVLYDELAYGWTDLSRLVTYPV